MHALCMFGLLTLTAAFRFMLLHDRMILLGLQLPVQLDDDAVHLGDARLVRGANRLQSTLRAFALLQRIGELTLGHVALAL